MKPKPGTKLRGVTNEKDQHHDDDEDDNEDDNYDAVGAKDYDWANS